MRNLKVKAKLSLSFGLSLLLIFVISTTSLLSMRRIQDQTNLIATETLSNTEHIWEMRTNLISSQRYALMAFADEDPSQISNYVNLATQEIDKTRKLFDLCKNSPEINQNKLEQFSSLSSQASEPRTRIFNLLLSGTENDAAEAFRIFKNEYNPLQLKQLDILIDIGNDQVQAADRANQEAHKLYRSAMILIICSVAFVLVANTIIILRLIKSITTPLHQIRSATNALAHGDFNATISYESQDEFGDTCQSIETSFTELKRVIADISENFNKMANGNFAFESSMQFPGEMYEIEQAGGILLDKLNAVLWEIKSSANQIRAGADQVASGAQALAQGATEQASSIEELSASLNDVSQNVNTNAENSKKANMLAMASGEVAQSTLRDMQEMLSAMNQISASSESIHKVIQVIDDITFQTNILSLNAAVEAARAGIAGKGFAVVADEVRNLAQKSSESAKEITALIESTIAAVAQGEQIAQKTSTTFNELTKKIQDVVATVNDIATASEEQANTIQQITTGVDQISAVVQTNSATSEESAAASEELSGQANILNELVAQFTLRSDGFAPSAVPSSNTTLPPVDRTSLPTSKHTSSFDKY